MEEHRDELRHAWERLKADIDTVFANPAKAIPSSQTVNMQRSGLSIDFYALRHETETDDAVIYP